MKGSRVHSLQIPVPGCLLYFWLLLHGAFPCSLLLLNLLEWLTELKRRFCLLLLVYYRGYCQLKWKHTGWDLWVSVLFGVLLRTIAWGQPLRKLLIELAEVSSSRRLLLVMRCRYLDDFSTFLTTGRCMKLGWENFLSKILNCLKSYSASFLKSQRASFLTCTLNSFQGVLKGSDCSD